MLRLVTYLPSRPANGPSFTRKIIDIVGSSTWMRGRAFGFSGSQSVSPMPRSSMPATADDFARARLGGLDSLETIESVELA